MGKIIVAVIAVSVLSACAGTREQSYESAVRDIEYRDRFIATRRACESAGGMIVIDQRIPKPIRNGVPDTGTDYDCVRR